MTDDVLARVTAAIREADTHDCEQGTSIPYAAMAEAAIEALAKEDADAAQ